MERLRDQQGASDPDVAYVVGLIAAVQVPARSEARTDALWKSLDQPRRRRRRRRPLGAAWVRLSVAAVLVLAFASLAIAGMTAGRNLIARWRKIPQSAAPTGSVTPRATPATAEAVPIGARAELTPPSPPAPERATVPSDRSAPAPTSRPGAVDRPSRAASPGSGGADPAAAVRAATWTPEVALVVDAVNALRRDHQPTNAAMLLVFYLDRYPQGALAEEALALAIEAADAEHRSADVARLGRRYLEKYPHGRFRDAAEHAVGAH